MMTRILCALLLACSVSASAATWYIDNRLTTGSNNGTSTANAWRTLYDSAYGTNSGSVAAGDTVVVVSGSGPYYEATNSTAGKRLRSTDISFIASTKKIHTAGAVDLSSYTSTNGYIRVMGSASNDGQYQVSAVSTTDITVASTHNLVDESAGANVRVIDVTPASSGVYVFDQGRHGTVAGGRITWELNRTEFSAGLKIVSSKYLWQKSKSGVNEWYVTRADGSNPGLVKPESAVVSGYYMVASATDTERVRGTVGSLRFINQYGYGDNDSLGFSTVYVRTSGSAPTDVLVNQVPFVVYAGWNYHTFKNGIWSFGNGSANASVNGSTVLGRANDMRLIGMIGRYADGQAWELRSPNTQTATFSSSSGLLATYATDIPSLSEVRFTNSGGALPTGLSAGTSYYTVRVSSSTSRLATSLANAQAGTVISFTDAGTGTQTMLPMQGLTVASSICYWAGHRCASNTGNGRLTVLNVTDWSAHVGVLIDTLSTSGVVDVYNSLFMNEEAGAIDKKTSGSTLNEGYNHFYPRMTDPNGSISNGSNANWGTTAATDNPASTATTGRSQAALTNPQVKGAVSDTALDTRLLTPKGSSPLVRKGKCYLDSGCVYADYNGARARVPPDIGAIQHAASD